MERFQNLVRSLKTARSYALTPDPKQAYYQLLAYVMQKQHKIFIELLESSPSFNINFVCVRSHRTLLHMAANVGAYECLQYLLKRGAVPNLPDRQGITPLQVASRNGFVRCIVKLLENGADIEIKNNEGMTAIHWLASNGRTEVFAEIQKYISNVDVKDDNQQTPLHVACLNGHKSTVLKLIEMKADIEMENICGNTPLYFACRHGHAEVVIELLQRHAAIKRNNNGESPVDAALNGGYSRVCCALVEVDPNVLETILQNSQKEDIETEKVIQVLTYLMFQDSSYRNYILIFITKAVHNEGMKLLSQSSDYERSAKLFLGNIKMLKSLLSFDPRRDLPNIPGDEFRLRADSRVSGELTRARLDSSLFRSESSQMEKLFGAYETEPENVIDVCTELTELWNVLGFWMCILQKELADFSEIKASSSIVKHIETDSLNLLKMVSELSLQTSVISSESLNIFRQPSRNSVDLDRLRLSQPALQFNFVNDLNLQDCENFMGILTPLNDNSPADNPTKSDWESEDRSQPLVCGRDGVPFVHTGEQSGPSSDAFSDLTDESCGTSADITNNVIKNESGYKVIDMTGDRLCCLIHGFFLYSQCQSVWNKLRGKMSSFNKFIKKYEDVLILLVSRNPQLIFEHFNFILESPILLQKFLPAIHKQPLKERQKWFYERLHANKHNPRPEDESVIDIVRSSLLETSCKVLSDKNDDSLKDYLAIRFHGEEGVGAGVTREWFDLLVKEILNPDCALFTLSADGTTFQPNCNSAINPDHLSYFQLSGRVMGLALYHKHLITAYFTRSFYKHILGIPVSYADVESIDPEYSKNLQWLLDNSIDNLGLDISFAVETDVFGQTQEVELKTAGKSILVNDENKFEYVYLAADLRMTKAIKCQMFAFLKGFYEFIPHSLALLFNEYELELMLSGVPDIDIEDWKKNTTYQAGYTEDSSVIQWFWEVVSNFSQEEQIQLLQFVTGTSRVPWGGFSNLSGINGSLFTICRTDSSSNMLPTASTCFNLVKLPEYTSKDELEVKLKLAVTFGSVGFEFT